MNRWTVLISFGVLVLNGYLTASSGNAAVIEQEIFLVNCRLVTVNIPDIPIYLDADAPGNTEDDDWGDGYVYTGDDRRESCNGETYVYSTLTDVTGWSYEYGGNTHDAWSNAAYWFWVYYGYDDSPDCDYTQNCHGYAFGVGDWPYSSESLIDGDAVTPYSPCWTQRYVHIWNDELEDCSVASTDAFGHSFTFTPKECSCGSAPNVFWIVDNTSEQFRESGTFTLSTTCCNHPHDEPPPPGVDYTKGQGPRSNLSFLWYENTSQ